MKRALCTIGCLAVIAFFSVAGVGCKGNDNDSTLDWTTSLLAGFGWVDNNDSTITDSNTRFMWAKCSHGQAWNASLNNCAGTGSGTTNGAKSVQFCEAVSGSSLTECVNSDPLYPIAASGPAFNACVAERAGGHSDWRLPNSAELEGLAASKDRETFQFYFPQTPDDKPYWTGDGDPSSEGDRAYGVNFAAANFGLRDTYDKAAVVHYVRCMRGP